MINQCLFCRVSNFFSKFEVLSWPVKCFSVNTKVRQFLHLCAANQSFRSLDTNSFPLSDTTVYGVPNREKIVRRHLTTFHVDRSVHGKTSSQLSHLSVKSVSLGRCLLHLGQVLTNSRISLSMNGHQA